MTKGRQMFLCLNDEEVRRIAYLNGCCFEINILDRLAQDHTVYGVDFVTLLAKRKQSRQNQPDGVPMIRWSGWLGVADGKLLNVSGDSELIERFAKIITAPDALSSADFIAVPISVLNLWLDQILSQNPDQLDIHELVGFRQAQKVRASIGSAVQR